MDPQIVEVRTWSEGVMWELSIVLKAGKYRSQELSLVPPLGFSLILLVFFLLMKTGANI